MCGRIGEYISLELFYFVTDIKSNLIRRLNRPHALLTPSQIRPKSFEFRCELFFFFGVDASCVYVRATTPCCCTVLIIVSTQTCRKGNDSVIGQLRGNKECFFSGVTSSGCLEEGARKRSL